MKILKRVLAGLLILVVVVAVLVSFFMGGIIKSAVETVGPKVTGVDITLDKAVFYPIRGKGQLAGLVVGNPEGFKTPEAFRLGELSVNMRAASVLSDTIHIRRIYIQGPEITMERGLKKTNLGALMDQIGGEKTDEAPAPEEKPEPETPEPEKEASAKKVVIDEIVIEGARVNLSLTAFQGKAAPVPLPTIRLADIGKEKGGASLKEVIQQVLGAITDGVTAAAGASIDALEKGAKGLGEGVMEATDTVGGLAGDGAKALGDATSKGAEALGDGASKIAEGISGFLKKDKEE